ncbi:hypothetical protein MAR_033211 [Mya arenaria]|uniref:EF-hand domain-containing protein n=1 Tax=Mya arenaria TaxID=6604 RepID=A0ABY7GBD4_MYAAR|nr:hypothetical protein MAR_033211 [Mya arenaria]
MAICIRQTFTLPNNHDLTQLVNTQFNKLDADGNGELSMAELHALETFEDTNHDGNVTLQEYMDAFNLPMEVAQPIFNVYDKNHDGVIPENFLADYYHLLDKDTDGIVTMHEYDKYVVTLMECLFGHGHGTHGHGPNCDH